MMQKSDKNTTETESCQNLQCENGGMFIGLTSGHCGCLCPHGYRGQMCEKLFDPNLCNCANGGRCVKIEGSGKKNKEKICKYFLLIEVHKPILPCSQFENSYQFIFKNSQKLDYFHFLA